MTKRHFPALIILTLLLLACTPASLAEPALSPTTGLPTDTPYRPVLAVITNTPEARPLHGLAKADIVYEAIYWGPAHTRYLALFNDEHPETTGGIRSARIYQNELREMWDCPYVFWGSQGLVSNRSNRDAFFHEQNVPESLRFDALGIAPYPGLFFRIQDNAPPHNAMVNLALLVAEHWPEDDAGEPYAPRLPDLHFSDTPTRGSTQARTIDVIYEAKSYAAQYTYQPESRQYMRHYDGAPQQDADGSQVYASNVIVQYMWQDHYGGNLSLPIITTTGSGPADFFIDGTHIHGHWVRDGMKDSFRYLDEVGQEVVLLPGKTFVQMVPMEMCISFTDEQGEVHALDAAVQAK